MICGRSSGKQMGFYSAHIAISSKHLLVFVSVASAYEEELVHRRVTAYRSEINRSLQRKMYNAS